MIHREIHWVTGRLVYHQTPLKGGGGFDTNLYPRTPMVQRVKRRGLCPVSPDGFKVCYTTRCGC